MKFLLTNGSEVKFYDEPTEELIQETKAKVISDQAYKLYALVDVTETLVEVLVEGIESIK